MKLDGTVVGALGTFDSRKPSGGILSKGTPDLPGILNSR